MGEGTCIGSGTLTALLTIQQSFPPLPKMIRQLTEMDTRLFILTVSVLIQLALPAQEPGGSLITETGILKVPFRIPNSPTTTGTPLLYNEFVQGTIIFGNGNRADVSKLNYDASGGFLVFV